ncbi:MAG TPA: thiamine pyrophosphate-dependent enzyme [candidate division Zixibacteria bacterium]|nr:thiamine pyrophosphate-dependent enzyme [candidate division Zixibacteria bacterium]
MLGGHAVAQCLRNEGVRYVFCVPGESHIAVIDGLYGMADVRLITARHESGACFMAEGYAKSARATGVCLVTRGPGAANASIAVHSARYDSAPLVLLVGQVARAARGREAGQEIDYGRFFGGIAKWVVEVNDARQIARVMARAFHVARSGRPGPVVVSLPRDVLETEADIPIVPPYPPARPGADPALIEAMVGRIRSARKPVIVAGSGTQYAGAWQELIDFSEKFQIPVLTSYKRQDAFPNNHPNYAGNLSTGNEGARRLLRDEADLLVVIGCRLNQQTTAGFSLPRPGQPFVQIDADGEIIGQNARPEIAVVSDARAALAAALRQPASAPDEGRAAWIAEYHAAQKRYSAPPERPTRRVSMERVMAGLKAALPADSITATDAGSFGQWPQRYLEFDHPNSYVSPTLGCMGPGVPSAVAARLAHPGRVVVAHVGDGGFLMTGQEMATARQYGVKVIAIVYNNEGYNSIRMHQHAMFPGRPYGTELRNPDFAALGAAYGALGLKVERDEDFLPALRKAIAAEGSALIEVVTDFEHVTPAATLSELAGRRLQGE